MAKFALLFLALCLFQVSYLKKITIFFNGSSGDHVSRTYSTETRQYHSAPNPCVTSEGDQNIWIYLFIYFWYRILFRCQCFPFFDSSSRSFQFGPGECSIDAPNSKSQIQPKGNAFTFNFHDGKRPGWTFTPAPSDENPNQVQSQKIRRSRAIPFERVLTLPLPASPSINPWGLSQLQKSKLGV